MSDFDFTSLSPAQRIALADTLYDSAMLEVDAIASRLSPEQLAEVGRRIADVEAGTVELAEWDDLYADLMRGR
jgi:putative addiction module component (TIGR02574 family)